MLKARVHSIETMGLVDGPGIRVVVFMQGCRLRCAYCHNPDTWKLEGGLEYSVDELLNKVKRYKGFFKASGGGVTLSGGDPLLQSEFAAEFFRQCRKEGIHTALDTSGYGLGDYNEVLKYTDLVLLDIKHINDIGHRKLTGSSIEGQKEFLKLLREKGNSIWVRHVVVPGITDGIDHIRGLARVISEIPNVEKIELLLYHIHGVQKYKEMDIEYRLKDVKPLMNEDTSHLYDELDKALEVFNSTVAGNSLRKTDIIREKVKKIS